MLATVVVVTVAGVTRGDWLAMVMEASWLVAGLCSSAAATTTDDFAACEGDDGGDDVTSMFSKDMALSKAV